MDFLLLGRELPAFELRVETGKPPSIRYEYQSLIRLPKGRSGRIETLRWCDLLFDDSWADTMETAHTLLIRRFVELIGEDHPAQLAFFRRYVKWAAMQPALTGTKKRTFEEILQEPALLPFVWMNWMPVGLSCGPMAPRAPFPVDFVLIYAGRRVVIELNSPAQFVEYDVDPQLRGIGAHLCPERFTLFLRQDRWLRREGWEVFRFSQQEVESMPIELLLMEIFPEAPFM